MPDWLMTAFQEKSALVLEAELDRCDPGLRRLPEGRNLADFVSPSTSEAVLRAAERHQVSIEELQRLKPYACAAELTVATLEKRGIKREYGVDVRLHGQAQAEGKPIWGLEDPRTYDALLGSMDLDSQDEYLLKAVEDLHLAPSRVDSLIEAWYGADLSCFEDAQRQMPAEVYRRLVVRRNKWWVESIGKGIAEAPDALIVVGSLHLAGPDNLIGMLRQRGVVFERLTV